MIEYKDKAIVIAGGGGFIGGWLAKSFIGTSAKSVRVIDLKPLNEWHQVHNQFENISVDLMNYESCLENTNGADFVFNLAADMGGMGFIEKNKALCMLSVIINTNLLRASKFNRVKRYFFSSSACVYPGFLQSADAEILLKESDAYPADAEDGYGWEKLFSERMCRHFTEDFNLETRVARFHNVYGPSGTFIGGREKAPAAICRKIAEAKINNKKEIEVWGDGTQRRSFMYIDDCISGIHRIFSSDYSSPINLGSSTSISINELVDTIQKIANTNFEKKYILNAPLGVKSRNSDNSLIKEKLNWEPSYPIEEGLSKTYHWINEQLTLNLI